MGYGPLGRKGVGKDLATKQQKSKSGTLFFKLGRINIEIFLTVLWFL